MRQYVCSCGRPLALVETITAHPHVSLFRLACVGRSSCGFVSIPVIVPAAFAQRGIDVGRWIAELHPAVNERERIRVAERRAAQAAD